MLNKSEVKAMAKGNWPFILMSLTTLSESQLRNKHQPCPMCGGKDRYRFDNKHGNGEYYCNQCGGVGDGFKLLMELNGWDFPRALGAVAGLFNVSREEQSLLGIRTSNGPHGVGQIMQGMGIPKDEREKTEQAVFRMNALLQQSYPITHGDPVDRYLRARGIALDGFPEVLRYHAELPYYDSDKKLLGRFPAMLAIIQNKGGEAVTLHRTYLEHTGYKANVPSPKKLFSKMGQGPAIRLFEPVNGKVAVAEGIETALAFEQCSRIPSWAAISDSGMKNILLPELITEVIIVVDHDESHAGERAAAHLSRRLLAEGRKIKRIMPPKLGSDFNDVLLAEINNGRL